MMQTKISLVFLSFIDAIEMYIMKQEQRGSHENRYKIIRRLYKVCQ